MPFVLELDRCRGDGHACEARTKCEEIKVAFLAALPHSAGVRH